MDEPRAMNTFIFTVNVEYENEAGETVIKRFDSVDEAITFMDEMDDMYRRCNCENKHCAIVHELGACQATATIACKWIGQICEACAAYMPSHYLMGALR